MAGAEDIGSAALKLLLPRCDLIGVDVELLGKLCQRSIPLMAESATFALKAGVWFRRGRLFMVSPDSRAYRARRQAETPLSVLFKFASPALR